MTQVGGDRRAARDVSLLREEVNRAFERQAARPTKLNIYATSKLPPAGRLRGCVVMVDETSRPAYSDGLVWRYFDATLV